MRKWLSIYNIPMVTKLTYNINYNFAVRQYRHYVNCLAQSQWHLETAPQVVSAISEVENLNLREVSCVYRSDNACALYRAGNEADTRLVPGVPFVRFAPGNIVGEINTAQDEIDVKSFLKAALIPSNWQNYEKTSLEINFRNGTKKIISNK